MNASAEDAWDTEYWDNVFLETVVGRRNHVVLGAHDQGDLQNNKNYLHNIKEDIIIETKRQYSQEYNCNELGEPVLSIHTTSYHILNSKLYNICMYIIHVLVIYTVYSITFKIRLEQWPKMTEVPFKRLFHKYFCIIIVGMQCNKLWLNSVNLYINDIDGRCVHI